MEDTQPSETFREAVEENTIRKILAMLKESESLDEAVKKTEALLDR